MQKHNLILTTSGLVFHANEHFELLDIDKLINNSILNTKSRNTTELNSELLTRIKNLGVHSSKTANEAYDKFKTDRSFENFIRLTEIASDILSPIPPKEFFLLQAENKYISNLSFMMLLELANGNFETNHHRYSMYTNAVRIIRDKPISTEEALDNLKAMKRTVEYAYPNWNIFISQMSRDKDAFASFFYCMFVSSV